jgi:glucuronate isomerase
MAGNFPAENLRGKVQYGTAWWFLDQKNGIESQINALSNVSPLANFIGMVTDSRSFMAYPRHEYFRRVLCNLLGTEMEDGLIPNDTPMIGEIIRKICFTNAKEYLSLEVPELS